MALIMQMKSINAFKKIIPSVFVIETPLQAICAVQAIRDVEIINYKVIVWYSVRVEQVCSVLKFFNVGFVVDDLEIVTKKKEWLAGQKN